MPRSIRTKYLSFETLDKKIEVVVMHNLRRCKACQPVENKWELERDVSPVDFGDLLLPIFRR